MMRQTIQSNEVMLDKSLCPNYNHYSKSQWAEIEKAVLKLPAGSPIIPVLEDYLDLLDKLKICDSVG